MQIVSKIKREACTLHSISASIYFHWKSFWLWAGAGAHICIYSHSQIPPIKIHAHTYNVWKRQVAASTTRKKAATVATISNILNFRFVGAWLAEMILKSEQMIHKLDIASIFWVCGAHMCIAMNVYELKYTQQPASCLLQRTNERFFSLVYLNKTMNMHKCVKLRFFFISFHMLVISIK